MRGDFRLANEFKKQNPRKIMKMWAEKEMLNLKRMKKFGMTCPEVMKYNVLPLNLPVTRLRVVLSIIIAKYLSYFSIAP